MSTAKHDPDETVESEIAGGSGIDPQVLVDVIGKLRPLSDLNRIRTVEAALLFLNTRRLGLQTGLTAPNIGPADVHGAQPPDDPPSGLPRRAQVWLTQSKLTPETLSS